MISSKGTIIDTKVFVRQYQYLMAFEKPIAYAALILAGTACAVAFQKFGIEKRQAPAVRNPQVVQARVQPSVQIIDFTGRFVVDPKGIQRIGPILPGQMKQVKVKPGDRITKGQTLAILVPQPAAKTVEPAVNSKAEKLHAERLSSALGDALQGHEQALKKAEAKFLRVQAESKEQIRNAQSQLDRVLNSLPQEKLTEAQSKVAGAKSARDKAKTIADRDKRGYEQGWIARNQSKASTIAYEISEKALSDAQGELEDAQRGPSKREILDANQNYQRIKEQVESRLQEAQTEFDQARSSGLAYQDSSPLNSMPFYESNFKGTGGRIMSRSDLKSVFDGQVLSVPDSNGHNEFAILMPQATWEFVGQISLEQSYNLRIGTVVNLPGKVQGYVCKMELIKPESHTVMVHIKSELPLGFDAIGRARIYVQSSQ